MLDTAKLLRLDAFRTTPLTREPFPYLIVEGFVGSAALAAINADYPKVSSSGSFPVDEVSFGAAFQKLLDELESEEFRAAFEEKFAIDLSGRPTVTTVRGRCVATSQNANGACSYQADGTLHCGCINEAPE